MRDITTGHDKAQGIVRMQCNYTGRTFVTDKRGQVSCAPASQATGSWVDKVDPREKKPFKGQHDMKMSMSRVNNHNAM